MKVIYIVKAHVQVQSKSELGIVKNISYQAKGPFIVTKDLYHNAFEVKLYNRPNSATRKYKALELYLLTTALYHTYPIDIIDQRYLNYKHAPILHPLKIQCKSNYIIILTSIQNPLACKKNYEIKPLCTSTTSHFNPMTPNYLHLMNFANIQIIHHTSSTPIKLLTCHQTLTYLHSINKYQTVQTSYFSSFTDQPTR